MKCCLESCSNPARLTIEDKNTLKEIRVCFNCFKALKPLEMMEMMKNDKKN